MNRGTGTGSRPSVRVWWGAGGGQGHSLRKAVPSGWGSAPRRLRTEGRSRRRCPHPRCSTPATTACGPANRRGSQGLFHCTGGWGSCFRHASAQPHAPLGVRGAHPRGLRLLLPLFPRLLLHSRRRLREGGRRSAGGRQCSCSCCCEHPGAVQARDTHHGAHCGMAPPPLCVSHAPLHLWPWQRKMAVHE